MADQTNKADPWTAQLVRLHQVERQAERLMAAGQEVIAQMDRRLAGLHHLHRRVATLRLVTQARGGTILPCPRPDPP